MDAPPPEIDPRSGCAAEASPRGSAVDPLVEALPWASLPPVSSFPEIDDLHDPHQAVIRFIDSTAKAKAGAVLSAFYEECSSRTPRPDWLPSRSLETRSSICMILHLIKRQHILPEFIKNDVDDTDLPIDIPRLQSFLKDSRTVKAFSTAQHKATLRDLADGVTVYQENELLPFLTIGNLGSGGYARVDCVEHVLRGEKIAHKVFRLTSRREQSLQKTFQTEIQSLKRLSGHHHIVEYLGAYESPRCLGLLMHPVATCDLYSFLDKPQVYDFADRQTVLLRCFGCLTSALAYMHFQKSKFLNQRLIAGD
jgi:hypothetical protein